MSYEEHRETGQIAFEAFCRALGYYTRWDELSERDQDAWREAAHEVMQKGWVNSARHRGRHSAR